MVVDCFGAVLGDFRSFWDAFGFFFFEFLVIFPIFCGFSHFCMPEVGDSGGVGGYWGEKTSF